MARANGPFGFRPVGSVSGGGYNGTSVECAIPGGDGTDTFVGDFVKLDGGGTTFGTLGATKTGLPTVIQCAAGEVIFGVVVGFAFNSADLTDTFALGSNANDRICYVVPAANGTLFLAQEDGATDNLTVADIGSTTDIVVAAGDTTYGVSGMSIDSDGSLSTSGSAQLRILSFYQDAENEIKTDNTGGPLWIVTVTEPQLGLSTATIGV